MSQHEIDVVAAVLGHHAVRDVQCAGRVTGWMCVGCNYESDHGWTALGARLRGRQHQAQEILKALGEIHTGS